MTVADRIAVMDQGKIIQVATPAEIYEEPNSRYVADFIGDINLLEGKVAESQPRTRLENPSLGTTIVIDQTSETEVGKTAWLAIRPEKIDISLTAPQAPDTNSLTGEVWDIGYLGDISIYRVRLENGDIVKASMTNRTRLVERPITWHDKVWLTWSPDGGVILAR